MLYIGGSLLVLSKDDGKVVIFSITNNEPKRIYEVTAAAYNHAVTGLCFSNNSLSFLTGSKDGRINLWSIINKRWLQTEMKLYRIYYF